MDHAPTRTRREPVEMQPVCRGIALLCTLWVGCVGGAVGPPLAVSTPAELCRDPALGQGAFCLPAKLVEGLLRRSRMTIVNFRATTGGTTGPKQMRLRFADPRGGPPLTLLVKWKAARQGADGLNNNPRREIAAYAIQRLFLTEAQYVVPPTVGRCIALEVYRRLDRRARSTFSGTRCVFGVLSYWLQGVQQQGVYDETRFARDPSYRANIANLNILTYLIEHRDSRDANFVISSDPRRPRVFAVDNGLSFGSLLFNPVAWFFRDWREIFVPALPRQSLARLRRLRLSDLRRVLAVVAEFQVVAGKLQPVAPSPAFDRKEGVRRRDDRVQFGLTADEIADVFRRLRQLTEKGSYPVF